MTSSQNTKHFDYSDTPQISPMARKMGVTGKMPADAIRDTLNYCLEILDIMFLHNSKSSSLSIVNLSGGILIGFRR